MVVRSSGKLEVAPSVFPDTSSLEFIQHHVIIITIAISFLIGKHIARYASAIIFVIREDIALCKVSQPLVFFQANSQHCSRFLLAISLLSIGNNFDRRNGDPLGTVDVANVV